MSAEFEDDTIELYNKRDDYFSSGQLRGSELKKIKNEDIKALKTLE